MNPEPYQFVWWHWLLFVAAIPFAVRAFGYMIAPLAPPEVPMVDERQGLEEE